MQVDRNLRVFGKKLRQEGRYLFEAEGHGHRKTQEPAWTRRLGKSFALRRLAFSKNTAGAIRESLPCVSERETARGAIEQPRAELFL